jgi:hypothetical protein
MWLIKQKRDKRWNLIVLTVYWIIYSISSSAPHPVSFFLSRSPPPTLFLPLSEAGGLLPTVICLSFCYLDVFKPFVIKTKKTRLLQTCALNQAKWAVLRGKLTAAVSIRSSSRTKLSVNLHGSLCTDVACI